MTLGLAAAVAVDPVLVSHAGKESRDRDHSRELPSCLLRHRCGNSATIFGIFPVFLRACVARPRSAVCSRKRLCTRRHRQSLPIEIVDPARRQFEVGGGIPGIQPLGREDGSSFLRRGAFFSPQNAERYPGISKLQRYSDTARQRALLLLPSRARGMTPEDETSHKTRGD